MRVSGGFGNVAVLQTPSPRLCRWGAEIKAQWPVEELIRGEDGLNLYAPSLPPAPTKRVTVRPCRDWSETLISENYLLLLARRSLSHLLEATAEQEDVNRANSQNVPPDRLVQRSAASC
jgi:hypothetical protein